MTRSGSQSAERALTVLQCIAEADGDIGVSEIGARTGLSVSTAHRLVQALRATGLVSQDQRSERYRLGPGAVALGRRAELRLGVDRLQPHLRELAMCTGESVTLGTRLGNEMLVVSHIPSAHPLRVGHPPGMRVPLHASAIGKVLLAFTHNRTAEVASLGPLTAFTDATITDEAALLEDVTTTWRRGWAINDGERDVGVRSIAAPLRNPDGTAWAGVAVQGPGARLPEDQLDEVIDVLLQVAQQMTSEIV